MAVKIKRVSKAQGEMNLASISDIVFLLLIYFMVVTVFQQDIGMPFVLPAATEQDQTVKIKESDIAALTISSNDIVTLDGVMTANINKNISGVMNIEHDPGRISGSNIINYLKMNGYSLSRLG